MDSLCARPEAVASLADCTCHLTIDLPNLGTMPGMWDLQGNAAECLGHVDLQAKHVLELGTFICSAMERFGADVVASDLSPDLEAYIMVAHFASVDPTMIAVPGSEQSQVTDHYQNQAESGQRILCYRVGRRTIPRNDVRAVL